MAKNQQKRRPQVQGTPTVVDYVSAYKSICQLALQEHPSLLGVFDCEDALLAQNDDMLRLNRFGLSKYKIAKRNLTDSIDFMQDPGFVRSDSDRNINNVNVGPNANDDNTMASALITIVADEHGEHTIVFVRKDFGLSEPEDSNAMHVIKTANLLHEIGHVDDFEKGINISLTSMGIVNAEVYAHRYACNVMAKMNLHIALRYYVNLIKTHKNSTSLYLKAAAEHFMLTSDYVRFESISRVKSKVVF